MSRRTVADLVDTYLRGVIERAAKVNTPTFDRLATALRSMGSNRPWTTDNCQLATQSGGPSRPDAPWRSPGGATDPGWQQLGRIVMAGQTAMAREGVVAASPSLPPRDGSWRVRRILSIFAYPAGGGRFRPAGRAGGQAGGSLGSRIKKTKCTATRLPCWHGNGVG